MSYNGTVRCRHCYGKGHNARTCPDKTESYQRRAQHELDTGEGRGGYWMREYAKRTGVWLDTGEKAVEMKKKRAGSVRRCKYCQKTGHNTRTCEELAVAKNLYRENALATRAWALEGMNKVGIGIGALIKVNGYGDEKLCYMVTGHRLESLNHEALASGRNGIIVAKLLTNASTADRWDREKNFPLPEMPNLPESLMNTNFYHGMTIVGPTPHKVMAPEGWLEGEDLNLTEIFDGRESPNAYQNRYENG